MNFQMIDAPTREIAIGRKISALATRLEPDLVDQDGVDQADGRRDQRRQRRPRPRCSRSTDAHRRIGEDLGVVRATDELAAGAVEERLVDGAQRRVHQPDADQQDGRDRRRPRPCQADARPLPLRPATGAPAPSRPRTARWRRTSARTSARCPRLTSPRSCRDRVPLDVTAGRRAVCRVRRTVVRHAAGPGDCEESPGPSRLPHLSSAARRRATADVTTSATRPRSGRAWSAWS